MLIASIFDSPLKVNSFIPSKFKKSNLFFRITVSLLATGTKLIQISMASGMRAIIVRIQPMRISLIRTGTEMVMSVIQMTMMMVCCEK